MPESRSAGVGVLDSGSSCSHIYYPGSRTGTNEFLIIRVGAGSIRTAVASLCAGRPFEATCYIDSFCFFHRSALYEKYGVTPDVKDFLVRRKEIGLPSLSFLKLLLPATWINFKMTHPWREVHAWLKRTYCDLLSVATRRIKPRFRKRFLVCEAE